MPPSQLELIVPCYHLTTGGIVTGIEMKPGGTVTNAEARKIVNYLGAVGQYRRPEEGPYFSSTAGFEIALGFTHSYSGRQAHFGHGGAVPESQSVSIWWKISRQNKRSCVLHRHIWVGVSSMEGKILPRRTAVAPVSRVLFDPAECG